MAKFSYKHLARRVQADIGPWHTEPDYDVKPNKNFDMVAAAARELAKEIERGTLNKDSWMSVMTGIYEANGYQHPTTQEAKQAMEMAQQIILNGQRGEGSPNIFNRKVYDQPRLDDLAETQMDWTPMPEGLAEKVQGWGEFPSGWDHPAFNPGRMRWGSIKTADKLHDFLMNPKSRPDLQTPEGQDFLKRLERLHNNKTDQLMPWLAREWKKGRIQFAPRPPDLHWNVPIRQHLEETGTRWNDNQRVIENLEKNSPETFEGFANPPIESRELNHMGDFLNSNHPLRREMGDIMQHHTPAFKQMINRWDQAMEEESKQKAFEGGEVVHKWPDNWTMRRLHEPEELKAEGDAMGHCVGSYHDWVKNGQTSIYSLRDPQGMPHVTTEIEPKYVEDEAGHRHKKDSLEGPFDSHEMSPEGGDLQQIQGRANGEPKDEYKQRLKEWFNTFEKKPVSNQDEAYIGTPHQIQPKDIRPKEEGEEDEYGLRRPPTHVDWSSMLDDFEGSAPPKYSEYTLHSEDAQRVYELAKARGEIPELGKEFRGLRENVQSDLQDQQEKNWDWWSEATGPHPEHREEEIEQMDPEERQEKAESPGYRYEPEWYTNEYEWPWDQKKKAEAEKDHEDREMEQWREHERDHYGAQHVKSFEELLKPHENTRTGEYQNEPYNPDTDPGSITYKSPPPALFSSWHI